MGKPVKFRTNGFIRFLAAAFLLAGAAIGAINAVYPAHPEFGRLYAGLTVHFDDMRLNSAVLAFFAERVFQYGKYIAVIWFSGFIPAAAVLVFPVLFIKGCGLAFAAVLTGSARGTVYALTLLGPQNLIWLPVCLYAACGSVRQGLGNLRAAMIMRGSGHRETASRLRISAGTSDYSFRLLLGILASAAAAFIETWLTPVLLGLI